ncbi:hypothetical protein [Bradyrhizobium sp. CCBAU 11361]|uniref:hypothetical protein n=1 Tax=Bradyrhizobium sp. CCBAU 11361 TaxID=1630812 RepID=UPI0023059AFC|nr:hypothetical protein [Bradyrhizobium sp. CCBAU 11361]MDA9493394.1 hypothetical protein [Bradyrhizobium sp. CCBAU 11361]
MFLLNPLSDWLPVNAIELGAGLIVWSAIVARLRQQAKSLAYAIAVALPLLIPILASVERDTQFMTIDETAITNVLLDPADRAYRQIEAGAFRTTLPVAVYEVRLMEAMGLAEDQIRMVLKAVHWLIGAFLLLTIYLLIARLGGFDALSPPILLFSVTALFVFPMSNITIKTFNYDMVSALAATISLLLAALAFSSGTRNGLAAILGAIVVATLAAQEKLSGSPILGAVLMASGVLAARRWPARPAKAAARCVLIGILISVCVSVASTALYSLSLPRPLWKSVWVGVADAMSSWAWVPMQILSGKGSGQVPNRFIAASVAIACLVGAGATIGTLTRRISPARQVLIMRYLPPAVGGTMLLGAAAGLLSTAFLQPYWAPFHPSPITPSFAMNGVWLHFGLSSSIGTRIAYVGYAFEILVVAMPTLVFLIYLIANAALVTSRREYDVAAGLFFLVALALAMLGALLEVPIAHRYLNIALFLVLTASLLVVASRAEEYILKTGARMSPAAIGAFILSLFLVIETAPFRPLYAAFRPYWLNYDDAGFAEVGRLNASWMGWGEERALLGDKLEKLCLTSPDVCRGAQIYDLYFGRWLPERPRPFTIRDGSEVKGKEPLGDHDYYLFNRTRIVQGVPQPKSRPVLTLDYRGYQMGWLYRGSDLAAENYRFGR